MRMTEKQFQELMQRSGIKIKDTAVDIKPKNNKYHNVKVYVYKGGIVTEEKIKGKKPEMVFDSKKEYERYCELLILQRAKKIQNFKRQLPLNITDDFFYNGQKIKGIFYKADFYYEDKEGNCFVEDVKPFDVKTGNYRTTKDFNLKWKLLKNKYPEYKFVIF